MEPTSQQHTSPPPADRPRFQPTQEVRFAVVMYGGVSLAIYIHGVAQELLRLVRASAPEKPFHALDVDPAHPDQPLHAMLAQSELRGTEKIYRKVALKGDRIDTRFVVDIISGTSAGGINGVFLAKALVRNLSMEALRELWVKEGDIAKLINDKISWQDLSLRPPQHTSSLLNGRRMYHQLLRALHLMEEYPHADAGSQPARTRSPLVDQLDLFVTATDLNGQVTPIQLSDIKVHERRHRKVFNLRYSTNVPSGRKANHFTPDHDPFLAFTARCTSSFPFAFEPMCLKDIDEIIRREKAWPEEYRRHSSKAHTWTPFFAGAADHENIPFGDGGYLDNKPFSYAIEAFSHRRADLPVRRKLLYVEPAPEHPEQEREKKEEKGGGQQQKPDALANVAKALLVLPRYETIREDIESVRNYNRLVERVRTILEGYDEDSLVAPARSKRLPTKEWRESDLIVMVNRFDESYGAYHRLKVLSVTDHLARLISRLGRYDEESDERLAIRYLVGAWREGRYYRYKSMPGADGKPTENEFVYQFDLWWRIRRMAFMLSRIDELHGKPDEELLARIERFKEDKKALVQITPDELHFFREGLRRLKVGLSSIFSRLQDAAENLDEDALRHHFEKIPLGRKKLFTLLGRATDEGRRKKAAELLGSSDVSGRLDAFAHALQERLGIVMKTAAHDAEHLLAISHDGDEKPQISEDVKRIVQLVEEKGDTQARTILRYFYERFEEYDRIIFPILYETGASEASEVDILRISPEDARALPPRAEGVPQKPKLAGDSFGHFGAFLSEEWRRSDITWGRLDGAERILCALLPEDDPRRKELIAEAQAEILQEELSSSQREILGKTLDRLSDQLAGLPEEKRRELLRKTAPASILPWLLAATEPTQVEQWRRLLEQVVSPERRAALFVERTQSNRQLAPEETLRSAARATEVAGKILEHVAETQYGAGGPRKWAGLVTWFGRVFWGLVEVSVPGSIPHRVFGHLGNLLVLFAVVLVASGLALGSGHVTQFGWITLLLLLGLRLVRFAVSRTMESKPLRLLKSLGIAVVAALAIYGAWEGAGELHRLWEGAHQAVLDWVKGTASK